MRVTTNLAGDRRHFQSLPANQIIFNLSFPYYHGRYQQQIQLKLLCEPSATLKSPKPQRRRKNAHPTPVNFHPPPPHPLPHRLSYVFPYADAGVAEILLPGGGGLPALTALTALGCGECPGKNLSSAGNSLLYPVYASASCLGAC